MLEACDALGFGWRAHIKTHKTLELTRLQVGSGSGPVNIIASTIIEAEFVLPLLLEYKSQGRVVNVLYSFPITPSAVPRLAQISRSLGPLGLSLMVDHVSQLPSISALFEQSNVPPSVFLKIDMGGHRAGVEPLSASCKDLIISILALSASSIPVCHFLGVYSHAGHSYASNSSATAMDFLRQELDALAVTAEAIQSAATSPLVSPLVVSVGATPTATSMRNLLLKDTDVPEAEAKAAGTLRATLAKIIQMGCKVEVHAGVYPTLDIQQLATHALPMEGPNAMLTWNNLALTVVAEVASLYPGRGKDATPEALIGAGCFALGREPCKAYSGWGMLTPWNRPGVAMPNSGAEDFKGWTVGRISQEHGILTFNGTLGGADEKLEVGQKVRIWPNHACITSGSYAFYLVVDGGRVGKEDEIIDVWVKCRGW